MGDRWIIANYPFHQHQRLSDAKKEHARLSTVVPDKTFRIYRIKTTLHASKSRKIITDLQAKVESLQSMLAALQPDA